MGTDLNQIGNHKIKFKERTFIDLSNEIKQKLDSLIFPNEKYLRNFALNFANSEPRNVRKIREIKEGKNWTYLEENEFYNFAEDKEIEFFGPFDLNLVFDENKIWFYNPSIRYRDWFEPFNTENELFCNEWRKYMYKIINLFGGNRVIYLADNTHPLAEFLYLDGTFSEIELALKNKFGEPKQTFKEVADDIKNSYFIDYFKDIEWSKCVVIDDTKPEPDDTSDINFDIETFKNLDVLKELHFDNNFLLHKKINNIIHFYHLSVYKGLLCYHKGQVGISENFNFILDKYAPFTFDKIEEDIQKEGYGNHLYKKYTLRHLITSHSVGWIEINEVIDTELLWKGLGRVGKQSFNSIDGIYEFDFYSVSKQLFLDLLFPLLDQNNLKGKLELFEIKNDVLINIYSKQM